MAESTAAKQQEKPTKSRVKPARERVAQKQLVSIRRGAAANELAEDQTKGSGVLQQRAAVRPVSGDAVSPAPVSTESRFGHDFSRVRTHTVMPQTRPTIQAKLTTGEPLTVNAPGDRYEQEADRVAEMVMRMPEPGIQLQPT